MAEAEVLADFHHLVDTDFLAVTRPIGHPRVWEPDTHWWAYMRYELSERYVPFLLAGTTTLRSWTTPRCRPPCNRQVDADRRLLATLGAGANRGSAYASAAAVPHCLAASPPASQSQPAPAGRCRRQTGGLGRLGCPRSAPHRTSRLFRLAERGEQVHTVLLHGSPVVVRDRAVEPADAAPAVLSLGSRRLLHHRCGPGGRRRHQRLCWATAPASSVARPSLAGVGAALLPRLVVAGPH